MPQLRNEWHSRGEAEKGAANRVKPNANNLQEVKVKMGINPRKNSSGFFLKAIDNAKLLLYNLAAIKETAAFHTGKPRKEQRTEQSQTLIIYRR